jgi:hypothetical protein
MSHSNQQTLTAVPRATIDRFSPTACPIGINFNSTDPHHLGGERLEGVLDADA